MDSFGNLIIIQFKHGKCPFRIVLPTSTEFGGIKQYHSEQNLRSGSVVGKLSDCQRCGMLNLIPFWNRLLHQQAQIRLKLSQTFHVAFSFFWRPARQHFIWTEYSMGCSHSIQNLWPCSRSLEYTHKYCHAYRVWPNRKKRRQCRCHIFERKSEKSKFSVVGKIIQSIQRTRVFAINDIFSKTMERYIRRVLGIGPTINLFWHAEAPLISLESLCRKHKQRVISEWCSQLGSSQVYFQF